MALSAKMAMLTCLGFIVGMCWLVSQVARPLVELPTPLIVRVPQAPGASARPLAGADAAAEPTGRFSRPSPVELALEHQPADAGRVLAVADELLTVEEAVEALPPLQVPRAPVVVLVDNPAPGIASDAPAGQEPLAAAAGEAVAAADQTPGPTAPAAAQPEEPAVGSPAPAAAALPIVKHYRVRRGDTLLKILRRELGGDDRELLEALLAVNPRIAERPNRIFVGEIVRIPDVRSAVGERAPAVAAAADKPAAARLASSGSQRWYTVRKRDSLAKIARQLLRDEHRWPEIAELNGMRNAHRLIPGMRLVLPPVDRGT